MFSNLQIHECLCSSCQEPGVNTTKELHLLMNHFLNTLEETQKALYLGLEAKKRGPGSERTLAMITGWSEPAIAAAQRRLEQEAGLAADDPLNVDDSDARVLAKIARAKVISFKVR